MEKTKGGDGKIESLLSSEKGKLTGFFWFGGFGKRKGTDAEEGRKPTWKAGRGKRGAGKRGTSVSDAIVRGRRGES